MVGSSETVALKLRVSQLEAALEELRRRIDALTAGEQGVLIALLVYGSCQHSLIQEKTRFLASQRPSSPNNPLSTLLLPFLIKIALSYLRHNFHPHPQPLLIKGLPRSLHLNQVRFILVV